MPGNANMYQKYRAKARTLDRLIAFIEASNVKVDTITLDEIRYRLIKLDGNTVIEKSKGNEK